LNSGGELNHANIMYVIIGSHFVPLEGKFVLIALVIVRITLNVIVRQMLLNVR